MPASFFFEPIAVDLVVKEPPYLDSWVVNKLLCSVCYLELNLLPVLTIEGGVAVLIPSDPALVSC